MVSLIGFSGVPTGSQFEITAGDRARGTSAGGWGVAQAQGAPRATIQLKRSFLQVAPEGMNFEAEVEGFDTPGPTAATGNYDPRFHEIYYVWNFGDPGKTFTKPVNILDEHRDANKAYGPLASHTYTAPGTYTVTLDVIEPASGKTAQATLDVTVNDPNGLFAGNRTIYVDPDADFSNAPAGAQTETDLETVMGIVRNSGNGPTDYFRIMLTRDKTHIWKQPESGWSRFRSGCKNIYMCAEPGTGARPIVRPYCLADQAGVINDETSKDNPGKMTDFTFTDLNIQMYWDTVTETQTLGFPVSFVYHRPERNTYCLFNNVKASGAYTFWVDASIGNWNENQSLNVMNDCEITDWANFAIYADMPGDFAVTGTGLVQKTDAASGGLKSLFDGDRHNEHGPVRIHACRNTVFDACDIFSRTGWFQNTAGIHTVQPGIRFAQIGTEFAKLNLQRCTIESPGSAFAASRTNAGEACFAMNMLLDKNYLIGGWSTEAVVISRHGGLTMRNNVVVMPKLDKPNLIGSESFPTQGIVKLECYSDTVNGGAENRAAPMKFYNNTWVGKQTTSEAGQVFDPLSSFTGGNFDSVPFDTIIIENNLDHLPEQAAGAPHAIEQTTLFPAHYDGYRSYKHVVQGVLVSDVAPGQSFTIPYGYFSGGVTGAGDFDLMQIDGRKLNRLTIVGAKGLNPVGDVDTDFIMATDALGVVVENNMAATWPAGAIFTAAVCRNIIYFRPEYGNPPDTIIAATLPPDSSALGAATSGPVAYDDMRGNPRPALPALGAYELE